MNKFIRCDMVLLLLLLSFFAIATIHTFENNFAKRLDQPLFVVIKSEIRHRSSGSHIRFPIDEHHGVTFDGLGQQQGTYLSIIKWWSPFPISCQFASISHFTFHLNTIERQWSRETHFVICCSQPKHARRTHRTIRLLNCLADDWMKKMKKECRQLTFTNLIYEPMMIWWWKCN